MIMIIIKDEKRRRKKVGRKESGKRRWERKIGW